MSKKRPWSGLPQQQTPQVKPAEVERHRQEQFAVQTVEGKFFAGPLPPADELKAYSEIAQDLPNRIVAMAENEQANRHRLQQRRMGAQIWISGLGQVFGFLLASLIIGIGGWLLAHDKNITGFVSLLLGVATVAGPFIYRRRAKSVAPPEQYRG